MKKTNRLHHSVEIVVIFFSLCALLSSSIIAQEQDQGDLLATMPDELSNVGTGVPISYEPYELAKFTKDMNR
ncbi:MAG: hypothetical protein AAGC43_16405, partial [Bacteroidota bacterium]